MVQITVHDYFIEMHKILSVINVFLSKVPFLSFETKTTTKKFPTLSEMNCTLNLIGHSRIQIIRMN